jgi:hypothetical protein
MLYCVSTRGLLKYLEDGDSESFRNASEFSIAHFTFRGTQWRSRLRHRATSRKVAGSILDSVIGIFH